MDEKKSKEQTESAEPKTKKANWLKLSIIANIVILGLVAVGAVSLYLLHQSDTNPVFCGTCHIMDKNVNSYLTSENLDRVHEMANVECKGCHEYPIPAEIASGIKFITGNYEVGEDGELPKRKYGNDMCLQCHISYDNVQAKTADMEKDPHNSHLGELACSTCHISHGEQIDYCAQCHDNGDQEMIKAPVAGAPAE